MGSLTPKSLAAGVYVPLCTFFHPGTEDVDIQTTTRHAIRMAKAGLGLVALGSMGEAINLTHEERNEVIASIRKALDAEGLSSTALIAGTGAGSTKETIQLCKDAKTAGATHVMAIAPGYFKGALDNRALQDFFVDVAKESPLPTIIYNFPGASAGIDLDTDVIEGAAHNSSNICGVKLTCGSVGKLSRLTSMKHSNFTVLGGFADFLLPSLLINGGGCITGLANVAPHTMVKLFKLSTQALQEGPNSSTLSSAQRLQSIVSRGDWTMAKAGINGTKVALDQTVGYGGLARRPIPSYRGDVKKLMTDLTEILEEEKKLAVEAGN